MTKTTKKAKTSERPLPADLEGMNDDRAEWARVAVKAFAKRTGQTIEGDGWDTIIMDLIADLAHLCDREGLELEDLVRRAANHYDAETDPTMAREDDYDPDDPDDHDISQDPFGTQFEFINGERSRDEALESCPKCGGRVRREESFVDHGEGDEAGRTFYYCSERCRETH